VLVLARHGDDGAGSNRGKTRKTDQFRRNSNVLTGSGQNPATISDMAEVESSRNMEHLITFNPRGCAD